MEISETVSQHVYPNSWTFTARQPIIGLLLGNVGGTSLAGDQQGKPPTKKIESLLSRLFVSENPTGSESSSTTNTTSAGESNSYLNGHKNEDALEFGDDAARKRWTQCIQKSFAQRIFPQQGSPDLSATNMNTSSSSGILSATSLSRSFKTTATALFAEREEKRLRLALETLAKEYSQQQVFYRIIEMSF